MFTTSPNRPHVAPCTTPSNKSFYATIFLSQLLTIQLTFRLSTAFFLLNSQTIARLISTLSSIG